jgi:hypothetical protein
MKAKDLIGKKVTRNAPANCNYGVDNSYMGDILIILNADDNLMTVMHSGGCLDGYVCNLSSVWCDDNWVCVDEFLSVVEENLKKIHELEFLEKEFKDKLRLLIMKG